MRILLLGTAYPWRGGIAHYVGLLAKYLRVHHHVDVVTFSRQYPKLLFPGKSQEETGDPGLVFKTETLIDSINPFNWIKVGLKLRKRSYDVVIFKYWLPFFGPCFGTICRILKYKRETLVLALCDNVVPHEKRIGDAVFTRYALGSVDGFLVQSNTVEKQLLAFYPDACYKRVEHPVYEIFGNCVTKEEARRMLGTEEKRIVLFFGYVRPYKGLDVLLDAMGQVSQKLPVKLYVVGEFYDDEKKYRERVAALNIQQYVQFVSHYVSNESVAQYFCAADCVVLPYRSATQSGIVQIAYHFDTPVIVTEVGGLTEVVVNEVTGFTVPPENSEALANAILKFYTKDWEVRLREGVRKEKKRFSWETLIADIEQFVDELKTRR